MAVMACHMPLRCSQSPEQSDLSALIALGLVLISNKQYRVPAASSNIDKQGAGENKSMGPPWVGGRARAQKKARAKTIFSVFGVFFNHVFGCRLFML
jgi:hypothetical protein